MNISRKKISLTIIALYSLVILVSFALCGIVVYRFLYRELDKSLGNRLIGISQTATQFVPGQWLPMLRQFSGVASPLYKDVRHKLNTVRLQNNLDNVVLVDTLGTVILSIDESIAPGSHFYMLESGIIPQRFLAQNIPGSSAIFEGEDHRLYKSAVAPVHNTNNQTVGFLFIEANAAFLNIFRRIANIFLVTMAFSVLTTLLVGLLVARSIVSPIHKLLRAVEKVDQGDLSVRVELKTRNEFKVLADYFNRMTANLEEKETRIRDKITSLEILSGGIAHEIRNPLNSIGLYADLMARRITEGKSPAEYLQQLRGETRLLNEIVNEFLSYARTNKLKRNEYDLRDLVEQTTKDLENIRSAKGVALAVSIPSGMAVWCDGPKLRQVFANLLRNAIDIVPAQQGKLEIRAKQESNTIAITFLDNGPGIQGQSLEKIFDPFFTTRADGTGLGLAIVQKITKQHGGVVYAANIAEAGSEYRTAFTVHLPIQGDAP